MRKITIIAVSCLFLCMLLSACFSPYAGDTGTITISVGGSGRVAWNGLETDGFTHIITLTNGPGPDQSKTIEPGAGNRTASFTVAPGMWTITVKGILDGKVVSVASERKNITAGANGAITIKMGSTAFTVSTPTEWQTATSSISSGVSNISYLINIAAGTTVTIPGVSAATFGSVSGIDVTISGGGTLQLDATNGSLLYIGAGQSVTLQNVSLQGRTDNNASLVYVNGTSAKFFMESGTISGNKAVNGGGVYVASGTFNMSSGEIFGNEATNMGGGVVIYGSGSTFNMNGGKIFGNEATNMGGGVYVINGKFTMSGNAVIGGTTMDSANTANNGGGVCVNTSGTFIMESGTISGNTSSNVGGGVYVNAGAFNMNGGEISGNKAPNSGGGGVYVTGNATFTMSGGKTSGNTANTYGGGVYVNGGSFRLITGIIVGNSLYTGVTPNLAANTAPNGAALYLGTGTATYYTDISGWNSFATTMNDTIHVENGNKIGAW